MKKLTCLIVIAIGFGLTGCLQIRPDGPLYFEAPKPPESDQAATIYLLRYGNEKQMGEQAWFYVDGKAVFNSYDRSFSWVQVPPGEHVVEVKPGFWDRPIIDIDTDGAYGTSNSLRIQAEPEKTYYARFERKNGPQQYYWAFSFGIAYREFYHETLSERLFLENSDKARMFLSNAV
jgi:hypothetical protein